MADPQSILQLGIEAARAGDKAEARELFRLVTREDPGNAQGWLWLAGVAEDREEKRVALEHVIQLDPSNDLARKGLAALGGSAAAAATTPPAQPTTPMSAATPPVTPLQPTTPMAANRSEDDDLADAFDSIDAYAAAPEGASTRTSDTPAYVPASAGFMDDDDMPTYGDRTMASSTPDLPERDRDRPTMVVVDDEDEEPRRRGGMMAWLPVIAALLILCALGAFFFNTYRNNRNQNVAGGGASAGAVASGSAAASALPGASAEGGAVGSGAPAASGEAGGLLTPEASGVASAPAGGETSAAPEASAPAGGEASAAPEASAPAGGEASAAPEASAPAQVPPSDVASANPAIVDNNQLVTAGQWQFGYSGLNNIATGSYGGATPSRGQYQIVLLTVSNPSGQPAQIPDGFFVLKDAQGRVYDFNRAASVDYFRRFPGSGDYAADAQIQPGAPLGSMPLLFDVAPDATNLVLFSRDNTGQGFLIR